jgi:amino acid adenylation domain-containing protein
MPHPESLVDYFEAAAARFPGRTAIIDPEGLNLSYAALDDVSSRIAGFLVAAGVTPGDRVGVIMPKGSRAVAAFLGIMKVRAAYVPADYTAPAGRNRAILMDCGVKVAFLDPSCSNVMDEWTGDLPVVVLTGDGQAPTPGREVVPWQKVEEHQRASVDGRSVGDLAYVLYTSGSTGVPKGVMISHDNALSFVDWCSDVFAPTEADRFSSHAPFHFDLSILDIYVPFKHGATVVVVSEELGKNPKELARFIADQRLTVWYSTPSILGLLVQFGGLRSKDCSALRLVLFAGEVFPIKHLRDLVSCWPLPRYFNLYGPTETNVCTFYEVPTPIPAERTEPFPIGAACSHCRALVLDEDGIEVSATPEGLLHIAGRSVFQGYWNQPEQSARTFRERPDGHWYNTGDVVSREGSAFSYRGRRDRMVKRRGYRIELGEIERGLYLHPELGEVAVVAVPDDAAGTRIVAFLSSSGERPSIIGLKTFCGANLPAYMSPDTFVFLDRLPRTSTDKVDYQRLRAHVLDSQRLA